MPFGVEKWDAIDHAQFDHACMRHDFAARARVETRFEEEAQPVVDLRICFDIGGFWIAWFSCRRVVEMKTRERNLSPTTLPRILRTGRFKKPRRGTLRKLKRSIEFLKNGKGDLHHQRHWIRLPRRGRSVPLFTVDESFISGIWLWDCLRARMLDVANNNTTTTSGAHQVDCVEEKRYGLFSVLVIISPCQQCGMENFMLNTLASVLPQATPKLLWVSVFFNLIRYIHYICESFPPYGYGNV